MQRIFGQKKLRDTNENKSFVMLMFPFVALFFLFTVLPVVVSVVLSFFSYDMISTPGFVGLENYLRMFTEDEVFPKALVNTLKFAVVIGPCGFLLSFVLGWFINEFSPRVRNFLSFLFYAPALGGSLVLIWSVMFSGDSFGYLNSILLNTGLTTDPIVWFRNETYNTGILMFIHVWGGMGVSFLANISGLQNVSQELYEAGALDGIRTRWHELWYITLPSMKTILLFSAVMQIQGSFSVGPTITLLAGYPSVNNSVDTLIPHLSDVGTARYEMGYAAALSVFLFAMMALSRVLIGKVLDFLGK